MGSHSVAGTAPKQFKLSTLGIWIACCAVLIISFAMHVAVGAKSIPLSEVFSAFFQFDEEVFDHIIIWQLRLPRALIAIAVGAGLSVAGALMQGVTRNPLAEPSILGLLHGASFAVVLFVSVLGGEGNGWLPLYAAIGALAAALLVWGIAYFAPGGATPLTLILSGAAVTSFLSALITVIKLTDKDTFESLRVWLSGSLAGRDLTVLWWCSPWLLAGLVIAMVTARQITTVTMGDEAAIGLGVKVGRLKTLVLFAVIALTASSVALAGPMSFIGLVIPHVVRLFAGYDYRRIVPYSAIIGSIYLLWVDIIARVALSPLEISTGIITAIVGAPLFVWLVRAKL